MTVRKIITSFKISLIEIASGFSEKLNKSDFSKNRDLTVNELTFDVVKTFASRQFTSKTFYFQGANSEEDHESRNACEMYQLVIYKIIYPV